MRRTRATTMIAGTVLMGLLLTGCSAFGGDDSVPKPTRQASVDGGGRTTAQTPPPNATTGTEQAGSEQAFSKGTVVAETDAVSKSGDTRIHVRVVANAGGTFDAELSGYRTTEPQPMSIEFRRTAKYGDYWDNGAIGATSWSEHEPVPTSVSLRQAGTHPDYLHDVVLVPAPSGTGDDSARPWVGSVLGLGTLDWTIPNPFPGMHIVIGKDRPGAYGYVFGADGKRLDDGGVPRTYAVAHGDDQTTVAMRFGITIPELRWLNPTMRVKKNGWIYEDTILNLDPSAR
ncbi:hypothetical protein DEJ28_15440 [Curtobacterium sp. MCPF17_002]|uniref:hypothetical protein n=1 Tax=Curtobacterium sp. MCPF17_002 TaxID=2175645 RepID=UPI0011B6B397|nr:hypothetical protein [Curtobacterium sp. MCPF17_002]WIB77030.1 hypothetical protein DEJ28_15440 [Curtobacterium sp. MCPF17_002]